MINKQPNGKKFKTKHYIRCYPPDKCVVKCNNRHKKNENFVRIEDILKPSWCFDFEGNFPLVVLSLH